MLKNKTKSDVLFLFAETGLHPGTGSALGTVDLPVARERHTGWPMIPGSSLKGVLRDRCYSTLAESDPNHPKLCEVFGPGTENASDHGGALSLTDARLLAFPVRSLRGLFAWVICPAVLERFLRDMDIAEQSELRSLAEKILKEHQDHASKDGQAVVSSKSLLIPNSKEKTNMVLEEFDYKADVSQVLSEFGKKLDELLGQGTRLGSHLALVSDNFFTHYTRFATEVLARIKLDYETKTVSGGALFYEEFLPSSTLFYTLPIATNSLKKNDRQIESADEVLNWVSSALDEGGHILQVGADATIGKGLCHAVMAGRSKS